MYFDIFNLTCIHTVSLLPCIIGRLSLLTVCSVKTQSLYMELVKLWNLFVVLFWFGYFFFMSMQKEIFLWRSLAQIHMNFSIVSVQSLLAFANVKISWLCEGGMFVCPYVWKWKALIGRSSEMVKFCLGPGLTVIVKQILLTNLVFFSLFNVYIWLKCIFHDWLYATWFWLWHKPGLEVEVCSLKTPPLHLVKTQLLQKGLTHVIQYMRQPEYLILFFTQLKVSQSGKEQLQIIHLLYFFIVLFMLSILLNNYLMCPVCC